MAGYIIVRKPSSVERIPGHRLKPVDNIFYQGMERLMWYDLDGIVFDGKLPDRLKKSYHTLKDSGNYLSMTKVVPNREDAELFLSIGGDWVENNELIVVQSDTIDRILGLPKAPPGSVNWLGYDIMLLGAWSLIKHGIFENRQFSLLEQKPLNSYGLFEDLEDLDKFLAEYNRLGQLNKVDPLLNVTLKGVRVGRPI